MMSGSWLLQLKVVARRRLTGLVVTDSTGVVGIRAGADLRGRASESISSR